ncbi:MAG: hypothetical protein KGL10_07810 [Alphaproteobacteria bacterium]|nr:hypothetical protein [Alphaproteobacteria bacterium]MDE2337202.1 hypothetical protein [Alphaproteobacteria bacterium]
MSNSMPLSKPALLTALLFFLFPASAFAQAAKCPVSEIPLSIKGAKIGASKIILKDGAKTENVMSWYKPMLIRHGDGSACLVDPDVSIITQPVFSAGGRILYVTTYSGSLSVIYAVNIHDCGVLWHSPTFTGSPVRHGSRLRIAGAPDVVIGPSCLPLPAGK